MKKKNYKVTTSTQKHTKIPGHIWLIGLLFIFIYTNGIYDYFMMLGHNVDYYNSKNYGKAVFEYFTNYPIPLLFLWTINIFSGFLAPILLLFRTRWTVHVSFVSSISMLCLDILTFTFKNRWNVLGSTIALFDIVLLVLTCGFFFYCKLMEKQGVLK